MIQLGSEITEIPANKNVIKGKWVYTSKLEADGQTKGKADMLHKVSLNKVVLILRKHFLQLLTCLV